MDNDAFNVPVDMVCQYPIAGSGNFPPPSFYHSNRHDLNNQNQIVSGFPALSIQGEIVNELHGGYQFTSSAGIATSNAPHSRSSQLESIDIGNTSIGRTSPLSSNEGQYQFMAGIPISAPFLATLLAERYGSGENCNDVERLPSSGHHREVPEILASHDYSDIVQSPLGTSVDYGYDGMLGNFSSKWDSVKFSAPQYSWTVPQRTGPETYQMMGNLDHSGWILSENNNMSSDNTSGSSKYSNELSLSLSTSQPATICGSTIVEHCSGMSSSDLSSHSLHGKQLSAEQSSYNGKNLSLTSGYKHTQLSQVLSGSRFLSEMQEVLAEIARYSLGSSSNLSYPTCGATEESFSSQPAGRHKKVTGHDGNPVILCEQEAATKKKHLIDLLQMVDTRYNQSLDEIHKVISAFHSVTELDPQVHARFALQTVSLLYKSLTGRISNYILSIGEHVSEGGRLEEEGSFETSFIQKQWALQQLRRKDHQLWRPQRGLPERSVSVLRAWMFQNFLHPYPKDADKHLLAVKSGLTRSQVSNWFINARVRIWKPMIDEMYSEMNRRKACWNDEETSSQRRNHLNIDNNQRFRMI